MDSPATALSRVRRPDHTGENRCLPCTAVNVVLAAAFGVVAGALLWPVGAAVALATGVGTVALGLLVTYLRGYLVPGTPTLTRRYLPDRVLARFDHGRPGTAATDAATTDAAATGGVDAGTDDEWWETDGDQTDFGVETPDPVNPEVLLRDAGAVEPCADRDDLCLTDDFAAAVHDAAGGLREDDARREAVADLFDAAGARLAPESGRSVAYDGESRLNGWPSTAALVADLAADRALADASDRWGSVPTTQRASILRALRSFLESCPVCGGRVGVTDDTVESCCRSWNVLAVRCGECDAHFLELDPGNFDDQTADRMQGVTAGGFTR